MDILTYGLLNKKVEEAKNVSGEKITEAVNTYLDENPPTTGATAEQITQIGKNVADISELKTDVNQLSEEKVDQSALGLVIGTDGKIYVAINGVATGSGIEITDGTASGDEAVAVTYLVDEENNQLTDDGSNLVTLVH